MGQSHYRLQSTTREECRGRKLRNSWEVKSAGMGKEESLV